MILNLQIELLVEKIDYYQFKPTNQDLIKKPTVVWHLNEESHETDRQTDVLTDHNYRIATQLKHTCMRLTDRDLKG